MQALLYADLNKKILTEGSNGTSPYVFPPITQGDKIHIGLRFLESVDGSRAEVTKSLKSIRASIGYYDERPESGFFTLKKGEGPYEEGVNQSIPIAHNATARAVQSALAGIGLGGATVVNTEGSWLISNDGAQIEDLKGQSVSGIIEALKPLSFVRVREHRANGAYHYEVRLIQSPLASTVDFVPVLPAMPQIYRVQEGGSDEFSQWPEIQALKLTPNFRGAYIIRRGFKRTGELSIEDGINEISTALELIADEDGSFTVTNPRSNIAHITFGGIMNGIGQPLLNITVTTADVGDPTLTLDTNTVEVAEALRGAEKVSAFLEIEAEFEAEDGLTSTMSLCKSPITIEREMNWAGLETASNIDWLRPPYGESYVPFTQDQILFGSQHYSVTIGEVGGDEYEISHNLDTTDLHISVYDNTDEGRKVEPAYIKHENPNVLLIGFANVATENQYRVVITTAGPRSAFQAHTHTMDQIVNLGETFQSLDARVLALEYALGVVGSGVSNSDPEVKGLKLIESEPLDLSIPSSSTTVGGRPVLLGAIHDVTPQVSIPPFTADSFTKQVRQISSAWLIPAGRNRRAWPVKENGYVASNGSIIYEVRKKGNSYYPVEYEQDLFLFWIEANMLPPQRTLRLKADPSFQLKGNTRAQYMMEVSFGQLKQEEGDGYGPNLESLEWADPVITQRVVLTASTVLHPFYVSIYRNNRGEVATTCTVYGRSYNCTPPVGIPFAIRARMLNFDTENREGTRGVISIKMPSAELQVQ
jgi:hypothetical protein